MISTMIVSEVITMKLIFIEYPTCSTCRKAKKYLKEQNISFEERNIITNTPTKEELKQWSTISSLPLRKFFNTAGNVYQELHLKDTIHTLSEDEMLTLLSSHAMLIKRPLLISEQEVLVGYKEDNYQKLCSTC